MLFGLCVAGGGVGAERRGGGDQLSGVGGEYWSVEEFCAGGGELVGEEEVGGGESGKRDGYALLFGVESVEKRREPREDETSEGTRVGVKWLRVEDEEKRQQSCRTPQNGHGMTCPTECVR